MTKFSLPRLTAASAFMTLLLAGQVCHAQNPPKDGYSDRLDDIQVYECENLFWHVVRYAVYVYEVRNEGKPLLFVKISDTATQLPCMIPDNPTASVLGPYKNASATQGKDFTVLECVEGYWHNNTYRTFTDTYGNIIFALVKSQVTNESCSGETPPEAGNLPSSSTTNIDSLVPPTEEYSERLQDTQVWECEDGFWHIVRYAVYADVNFSADPVVFIKYSDTPTRLACSVPLPENLPETLVGPDNANFKYDSGGHPDIKTNIEGSHVPVLILKGDVHVRECIDGFWQENTYRSFVDPSGNVILVLLSSKKTEKPCSVKVPAAGILNTSTTTETPCPGGVLVAAQAYSECISGFWHVVEYDTYLYPDGSMKRFKANDVATGQKCQDPPPLLSVLKEEPAPSGCTGTPGQETAPGGK